MGKWAARGNIVRIVCHHYRPSTHYESSIRRDLTREFGPVEEVLELTVYENFLEAFAIFNQVANAKAALAATTIVVGGQTLDLMQPSNEECSRVGVLRKNRAISTAKPLEAWLPPRPRSPWSLPYGPDSRIHHVIHQPIRNSYTSSTKAMGVWPPSTIAAHPTVPPDHSILPKSSPLGEPRVGSSSTGAPSSFLNTQPTTQAGNQHDPATNKALHNKPAVTTEIAGHVTVSTQTAPSRQDLSGLLVVNSIRPSKTVAPSLQLPTPTDCTRPPSRNSQNLAVTEVGPIAPASAPRISCSRLSPIGTSTTPALSTLVPLLIPSNTTSAPEIQTVPPSHPTLSTAPVVSPPILGGSQSNLSNAVVPSAVALGTAQRHAPSQNHSTPFTFQNQSPALRTDTRTLNPMPSLEGGGGFSGSSAAISAWVTPANPFSRLQVPLSGHPPMVEQHSASSFASSHAPVGMQQGQSNSNPQNPFGPLPVHPPVTIPVHLHPQSVSWQQWMGGGQQAARTSPTQVPTANSASLRILPAPAGSSVSQGDPITINVTQEQFQTVQTKFNALHKAHEEAVNARSKTEGELESERRKSEELSKRLEAAEKVVEQMKHEQEISDKLHGEELDRARNANAEQMKADIEVINEEWALKLRENEERLLQELEQGKRQVNEERELSSKREEELRALLQDLEDQGDWNLKLEAAEEERLKLQHELVGLNQAFLRVDAVAQVELSRRQELEKQLDGCWARERAQPELVKAFLLLDGVSRTIEGRIGGVISSTGLDAALDFVKMEDSPDIPVGGEAKRRRLE